MVDRPVLFSAPMIRAILRGEKTQTRRPIKPQPSRVKHHKEKVGAQDVTIPDDKHPAGFRANLAYHCRYGRPGDRLWVRENLKRGIAGWVYAADGAQVSLDEDDPNALAMVSWAHHKEGFSCPSIHMPKWASRITLELKTVRAQRLHEITEEDARAEGMQSIETFQSLWRLIHGPPSPNSWELNPWVWAVGW